MLRSILLKLSASPGFAHWVTTNGSTRRMALRFVAGETLNDAIEAARVCNSAGMTATLDYSGRKCQHHRRCATCPRRLSEYLRTHRSGKIERQRFLQAHATRPRRQRGILRRHGPLHRGARLGLRKFPAHRYGKFGLHPAHCGIRETRPRANPRRRCGDSVLPLPQRTRHSGSAFLWLPHPFVQGRVQRTGGSGLSHQNQMLTRTM